MVPLRGRIYKPLPGGSIINHKSQKLNYLRASRFMLKGVPLHAWILQGDRETQTRQGSAPNGCTQIE